MKNALLTRHCFTQNTIVRQILKGPIYFFHLFVVIDQRIWFYNFLLPYFISAELKRGHWLLSWIANLVPINHSSCDRLFFPFFKSVFFFRHSQRPLFFLILSQIIIFFGILTFRITTIRKVTKNTGQQIEECSCQYKVCSFVFCMHWQNYRYCLICFSML